jgi:predicted enzyme related to lactoylglutathione lyase
MKLSPTHVSDLAVIGIYVSDLQESKRFYIEVLGLEDKGEMGPGWMLALESTSFYLEPGRNKNPDNQQLKAADITICFSVESVKTAYKALGDQDVQMAMKYTEYSPEYAVFMISDPDGNIIELAGNP